MLTPRQDLDATFAQLQALGIPADGPNMRPWGERDVLVVDPDGNLVQFGQARTAGEATNP